MPTAAPLEPARDDDDEAGLLRAARVGDAAAFGRLVLMHQGTVRRQLRHLVRGSEAVADELAQDVFVQAWRSLADFRGEARLSTWLHRIAYRRFLMHQRAEGSRIETEPLHDEAALDGRPASATDATGAMSAMSAMSDDPSLRLDVAAALAGLPEAQRLAVFHCFQLELSHEEAAEVLGLPLGTLKSHVARGKAALRVALAAWAPAGASS